MARTLKTKIKVTLETGFCHGHFPGYPIVPGAVQMLWMVELATAEGLCRGEYSVRDLKLFQELAPGTDVQVELTESANGWMGSVTDTTGVVYSRCKLAFSSEGRCEE